MKSEEESKGSLTSSYKDKFVALGKSSSFFGDNLDHRNEALQHNTNSVKLSKLPVNHKLSHDDEGFEDEEMADTSIKSVTVFSKMDDEEMVRFADFKVVNPVGKGTFGKVYLVRCQKDGNFYAMKSIRKDLIIDHDSIGNLKLEK